MADAASSPLTVVGTGSWGVVLAAHAAARGARVTLLARTEQEARQLDEARESPRVSGLRFPEPLGVFADPACVKRSRVVLLVVPAQSMRQNVRTLAPHLSEGQIVVSASKGLEIGTTRRMSEVIREEVPSLPAGNVCALSGPNLAKEVAARKPSLTVVAGPDMVSAREVQALLIAPHLRVYTHTDIVGVELAGALKNVVALGAGMCDGLGAGDNAKAALMTRGLAEMARLGKAAGAEPLTFSGIAGLGDLIATCMSPLSRNRTLGERLARGETLAEIQREMRQVAEGVPTTRAVRDLSRQHGVEMPIAQVLHEVLFSGMPIPEAAIALMQRDPKNELDGLL